VTRPLLVLVNPSAGGGRALKRLPLALAELGRLGAAHRVVETRGLEHAREQAGVAAEAGENVAALGGDGLLREVACALCRTDSSMAILPGGRGNDLARVLGIPTDPTAAARIAVEGKDRMIDMAKVDGNPYLGIASFGFDSDANRIANDAKVVRGNLVYVYAALRALISYKPARFTVSVDGERHEMDGHSVAIANSRAYGGGMFMAPDAELDDGALDVVMIERSSRLRLLRSLPKVFKGTHVDDPGVRVRRGALVEVAADRPFDIYADGDPVGSVPATVTVDQRCLRVIVPR
jgi:YegS/Rv2252/BmrU family lipid kinase